jgi:hypothetical protein
LGGCRRQGKVVLLSDIAQSNSHGPCWRRLGGAFKVRETQIDGSANNFRFLADHFPVAALRLEDSAESGVSRLSIGSQSQETSADVATPVRSRVVSHSSGTGGSPSRLEESPRPVTDRSPSPLTPLRFIKRASDSPDVRKKEKTELRIGRRSILGKE